MTLRTIRGLFYRKIFPGRRSTFVKKVTGFERRWGLETEGFTKAGFYKIFEECFAVKKSPGFLVELVTGDGLVGSLGSWIEMRVPGWTIQAWEHRPRVFSRLQQNRPSTIIQAGRLTNWPDLKLRSLPSAVTTRGVREAAGVCRGIRHGIIHPLWLGIWNPSRRPVWYQRLRREGYRLEMVWQNMEFYRCCRK